MPEKNYCIRRTMKLITTSSSKQVRSPVDAGGEAHARWQICEAEVALELATNFVGDEVSRVSR